MKKLIGPYFYLMMSLLIVLIVAIGFVPNLAARMIYPAQRPPLVLYLHAGVCAAWIVLLSVQAGLVRSSHLRMHRQLGLLGFALGVMLPILGIATEIAMNRWHQQLGHSTSPVLFSISLNDMLSFAIAFGLAMWWRSKPEYHKRLLLIATCCLTTAAFARWPSFIVPSWWFYVFVDALIVIAIIRDLVVIRSVHRVYAIGLPALIAGQSFAFYLCFQEPVFWLRFSHFLLG